ncbi:hypothetical protein [Pseudomonas sp. sia0905]|uniref:hypothetical protein n=1 Tax=Pseudomonas sp. sia0905 TaxID=2854783 RepID=UPI001C48C531|nr:hypothetical protein [Pseudomonas sp. sia0905]MBV7564169.1 hypothetical protein [Pseudomonas sp. sia0905]
MSTSAKWIIGLVLFLITVIQSFIWYAAFVNAGNGSALNFVSFAGTLISIILAVLAIGYTYGESISQKSKGDALSIQIASLTEIASAMRVQSDALSDVTNVKIELENVANRIESGFLETRENVSSVSTAIHAVGKRFESVENLHAIPASFSGLDKAGLSKSILTTRTAIVEVSILIIAYFSDVKKQAIISTKEGDGITHLFKSVDEDGEHSSNELIYMVVGSVISLLSILEGVGLVTYEETRDKKRAAFNQKFFIDPALRAELQAIIVKPVRYGKVYALVRNKIISELQGCDLWVG